MRKLNLSKKFWKFLLAALIVWIVLMISNIAFFPVKEFWESIILNLIYGIPLSVISSIFSAWMYSHYISRKRENDAENFYQSFTGIYSEYKVVAGKKPELEWKKIEVKRDNLKLKVNFRERVYNPETLSAELELYGDLEKKRSFELFYKQESVNGYDEGYWGKYDIQLMDNGEVIGHKYHTASKANSEGRIDYIITRIKWVKKDMEPAQLK